MALSFASVTRNSYPLLSRAERQASTYPDFGYGGNIGICQCINAVSYTHLKEGRLWNDSVDQWTDYKMIINESAKSLLEIDNIETALIQPERRLWWSLSKSEEMKKNPPYQVIGVIKDFKIGHLSKTTPPLFIVYEDPREMCIRDSCSSFH